jgi:hypothetical protein
MVNLKNSLSRLKKILAIILKIQIMSLDISYSYCINLTEEEKLEIDKQV